MAKQGYSDEDIMKVGRWHSEVHHHASGDQREASCTIGDQGVSFAAVGLKWLLEGREGIML